MRTGVLAAGNWIIDQIKVIDVYPGEETLANITGQFASNGGCAYNVIKDLYMLGADFPLEAIGRIGNDPNGDIILEDCKRMGIDTRQLQQTAAAHTSYTDVMSVAATGRRTFFHQRGANALLGESSFDFSASNCRFFHLGYLLLLDGLDVVGDDGLTGAARVLRTALQHGFTTSVDLVSEDSFRFSNVLPPCLPFVDVLFVNEFELSRISGFKTINGDGEVDIETCFEAAASLLEKGVRQWVIIHFPIGALAMSKTGERLYQCSIDVTTTKIVGSVGAGDAFAAGVLLGLHKDFEMQNCLELGVAAACSSLFHVTPSEGIQHHQDCLKLLDMYGVKKQWQQTAATCDSCA